MSDSPSQLKSSARENSTKLFSEPAAEPRQRKLLIAAVSAVLLVALVGGLVFMHRAPGATAPLNALLPADPYAANLAFTQLAMSESTSLSGGKSTFLDGHVHNSGGDTLTGVTIQVLFKNDEGLSPTVETLPLSLIRTHEPYVDTQAVNAAPLTPDAEAEFRLVFEAVPANWNQQLPDVRAVHVTKR